MTVHEMTKPTVTDVSYVTELSAIISRRRAHGGEDEPRSSCQG